MKAFVMVGVFLTILPLAFARKAEPMTRPISLLLPSDNQCLISQKCELLFQLSSKRAAGEKIQWSVQWRPYQYDLLKTQIDGILMPVRGEVLTKGFEKESLPLSFIPQKAGEYEATFQFSFPTGELVSIDLAVLVDEGHVWWNQRIPDILYSIRDKVLLKKLLIHRFQLAQAKEAPLAFKDVRINSLQSCVDSSWKLDHPQTTPLQKQAGSCPGRALLTGSEMYSWSYTTMRPYSVLHIEVENQKGLEGKLLVGGAFVGFGENNLSNKATPQKKLMVFEKFLIEDNFQLEFWFDVQDSAKRNLAFKAQLLKDLPTYLLEK